MPSVQRPRGSSRTGIAAGPGTPLGTTRMRAGSKPARSTYSAMACETAITRVTPRRLIRSTVLLTRFRQRRVVLCEVGLWA